MTTSRHAPPRRRPPALCVRRARAFLAKVAATLVAKNADYGDSVTRPLHIFSRAPADEQLRVRIDDKLSRVARGARGLADNENTLLDLAGYVALLAAARAGRRRRRNGWKRRPPRDTTSRPSPSH